MVNYTVFGAPEPLQTPTADLKTAASSQMIARKQVVSTTRSLAPPASRGRRIFSENENPPRTTENEPTHEIMNLSVLGFCSIVGP